MSKKAFRPDVDAPEWKGGHAPYDIIKEGTIAIVVVGLLTIILATFFGSPDEHAVTDRAAVEDRMMADRAIFPDGERRARVAAHPARTYGMLRGDSRAPDEGLDFRVGSTCWARRDLGSAIGRHGRLFANVARALESGACEHPAPILGAAAGDGLKIAGRGDSGRFILAATRESASPCNGAEGAPRALASPRMECQLGPEHK